MQGCHLVAYKCRKLNEAEYRYTTHEKELLGLLQCLKVWRHYLLGSSFVVQTDNTAVSHFLSQSKLNSKHARWQELLAEFNFMLEYMACSTNSVANTLSRRAELDQVALMAMNAIVRADSRVAINIGKMIRNALAKDPVAEQLLKLVESRTTRQFWQEDGDEVQEYVKTCLTYQQDKVEHLPKVEDLGTIPVVVDGLSKYASFIATLKYCSAEDTSHLFFKYVVKYWGMPQDIVRNNTFEIVNGQQPLLPHTVNVPNTGKSPRAISFSEEWRHNIVLAHSYLDKVARRMKKHADKNRRSQEFNMGDKVMVKLLPQDRKFLRGRDSRLFQNYEGPLTILKKIGKMAYKVDPPH
ncbi:hypothetical protein RJ639_042729 [Escallonia herrerae]|uniref:Reverse transcriptase RNase H-like domain-containing protein n=1 Tax=Escallonia herrerae TaxID=1293975 RepID=A0AA88WCQ4_9ASTE|nr:hypothetical protein RJ639_042729 [Escallonia herrerae]